MDSRTPTQVETTTTFPLEGADVRPPQPSQRPTGATPRPAWVDESRQTLTAPGRYLAYEESGRRMVVPLASELTRIGRSLSAEVRFDDATVSRRHAVVASGPDGVRLLDDRSLNGVYVNGERVAAGALRDGDQVCVGRHSIWFLDNARVGSATAQPQQPAAVGE